MTFFKGLFRVLAASGAVAVVALINAVKAYVSSATPSDVSPMIYSGIAFVVVLALNFALSKIKLPA